MYKLLFGVFGAISIWMLVQSIQIVVYHFERLNEFGFGVLTGKFILFLVSGFLAYRFGKKVFAVRS